jgi:hypothetical protein
MIAQGAAPSIRLIADVQPVRCPQLSADQAKTTGREKLDQTFNPKNFSEHGNFSIAEVNIYD